MTKSDKSKLESIAKALIAYSDEAERNPQFYNVLSRVAVPGGYSIREFAMMAGGISSRNKPIRDTHF